MFARTSSPLAPWLGSARTISRARASTSSAIYFSRLACPETDKHFAVPDPDVVFPYDEAHDKASLRRVNRYFDRISSHF